VENWPVTPATAAAALPGCMHRPPLTSLPSLSPHTQYKKVEPVGARVVVEVDKAESTSAGGILLPTAAQVRAERERGREEEARRSDGPIPAPSASGRA
jgi:hypothetical protein